MTRSNGTVKRISLFLPDLNVGGAERVFIALANQFVQNDIRVDLVLAGKRGALIKEVDSGVKIVDLNAYHNNAKTWLLGIKTLSGLIRYLRKSNPEVLLSTLTGANIVAILAKILSLREFELIIREAATLKNVKSLFRKKLMGYLYPYADKIVVLTDYMKQELMHSIKVSEEKVIIIGNPVDTPKIRMLAEQYEEIVDFKPYVVSIGRLVKQKDYVTALNAISRVNEIRPIDYVVLGEGSLKNELELLAGELGIKNYVHFIGLKSNPYAWLNKAKVFVLSSLWEGYPNVLLEAMSLGCRIVITEYDSSIRRILMSYPKEYYRIVSVGDSVGMADAIIEFSKLDKESFDYPSNTVASIANQYRALFDAD